MPQMYCLTCFYDLRGLVEHRCPECGRLFSPQNRASFSTVPHKERFNKLVKQASSLLSDALTAVEPADTISRAISDLRRQVGRLSTENLELRQKLMALTQLLIERNLIDPAALAQAVDQLQQVSDLEIIDDTDIPVAEETETATAELLELSKAIDDQQQT